MSITATSSTSLRRPNPVVSVSITNTSLRSSSSPSVPACPGARTLRESCRCVVAVTRSGAGGGAVVGTGVLVGFTRRKANRVSP